jgi:hypothetical protein
MTKDRVGAGLAIVAAIIGLLLVFTYRDVAGGDDDDGPAGPAAPPSISQVVPAPGQGQPQPQQQAPQQAPQQGDGDGDDDG